MVPYACCLARLWRCISGSMQLAFRCLDLCACTACVFFPSRTFQRVRLSIVSLFFKLYWGPSQVHSFASWSWRIRRYSTNRNCQILSFPTPKRSLESKCTCFIGQLNSASCELALGAKRNPNVSTSSNHDCQKLPNKSLVCFHRPIVLGPLIVCSSGVIPFGYSLLLLT